MQIFILVISFLFICIYFICSFLLPYMCVSRSLPDSNNWYASSTQTLSTCRPNTVKVDAPIRTTRNCGRKSTTYCRAADHGGNYRRMEELGVAYPVTVNNRRHNMPGRVELLPGGQHTIRLEDEGFLDARTRSSGYQRRYTADVNNRL